MVVWGKGIEAEGTAAAKARGLEEAVWLGRGARRREVGQLRYWGARPRQGLERSPGDFDFDSEPTGSLWGVLNSCSGVCQA